MKTWNRWTLVAGVGMGAASLALAQQVAPASPKKPAQASTPAPWTPREIELMQRLDKLSGELEQVKSQLAELRQQVATRAEAQAPAGGATVASSATQAAAPMPSVVNGDTAVSGTGGREQPSTVIGSYAEMGYNHYNNDKSRNQADLNRFVLDMEHRFDEKTKVMAELELEHAVSSASDKGEIEVEQAYAERQLSNQMAMKAGLFLMPVGLLNENHEPTAYYGVERNFVETAIIPTTWREGGVQFINTFDNGVTLQGGLSTGFDVSAWDPTNSETAQSPLGAVHQELSQAHAKDPAVFAAVNWRGLPGLLLGGSYFTGNAGQGQESSGNGLRVTLWDVHARYTLASWDLSALYARGTIGGTGAFNTLHALGTDYPVPKLFDGGYLQAAYKVWSRDDLSLSPFVRLERFNTRKAFADIGQGLTASAAPTEQVFTLGANLYVGQGLVFKADVQRFKQNKDDNRFDLGFGWSF